MVMAQYVRVDLGIDNTSDLRLAVMLSLKVEPTRPENIGETMSSSGRACSTLAQGNRRSLKMTANKLYLVEIYT